MDKPFTTLTSPPVKSNSDGKFFPLPLYLIFFNCYLEGIFENMYSFGSSLNLLEENLAQINSFFKIVSYVSNGRK